MDPYSCGEFSHRVEAAQAILRRLDQRSLYCYCDSILLKGGDGVQLPSSSHLLSYWAGDGLV